MGAGGRAGYGPEVQVVIGYLTGIEVRRHWRSVLLLTLLVALVTGTVLASVAGGRRSRTSFDRYLAQLNAPDILATGDPETLDQVARLPMVASAPPFELAAVFPSDSSEDFFPMAVSADGLIPGTYLRSPVVAGRMADPAQPLEVTLGERTARRLRATVGDTIPMSSLGPESTAKLNSGEEQDPPADGPAFKLTVVGIVRDPGDIGARGTDLALTFLTPAFRDRFPTTRIGSLADGRFVVLRDGVDVTALTDAAGGLPVELDPSFSADGVGRQVEPTMAAIATALYVFAAVAAVAGLATIGHAVGRMQASSSGDDSTLAAIGVGRAGRWARLVAPGWAAVVLGAPLGIGLAVVASPLFPFGLARRAETNFGIHVDLGVMVVGGVASLFAGLALVTALGGLGARSALRRPRLDCPPSVVSRAAGAGAPPTVVTWLTMAVGARGGGRSTSGTAIAGTTLGVLGVVAALVFAASINRLVSTPSLYGWGWDANVEGADLSDLGADATATVASALLDDPQVEAVAQLEMQLEATIDGTPVFVTSAIDVKGQVEPVIVQGKPPVAADELAVARDTIEAIGAQVGDRVDLEIGKVSRKMLITGMVALPVSADGGASATGAYLATASAQAMKTVSQCEDGSSCYRNLAITVTDEADLQDVVARYEDRAHGVAVDVPAPPGEVERLQAVEHLPWYLAGVLGLLAGVAVTYSAAIGVRNRRRDLAMLRVIGMTASQLRGVVAVQVLVLTLAGGVLGSGLGLLVGRQVWRLVVRSLALPFSPTVPLTAVLLIPVATLVITQVAATFSRRAAGHTHPALALRSE